MLKLKGNIVSKYQTKMKKKLIRRKNKFKINTDLEIDLTILNKVFFKHRVREFN